MSMLRRISLELLCCLVVTAFDCSPTAAAVIVESAKAFPTAEGFGAYAVGGRGGRVVEVTNLNDGGPGSLRAAMEASGPRICLFRVSGTITLTSAIRVSTPYLTVAGQTSPGGVQVRGTGQPDGDWGVWFVNGAHDIIVRHLRVRMGGNMKHDAGNNLLWEVAHGLGPRDASDGTATAANGYSNVENYLNELAGDPISRP